MLSSWSGERRTLGWLLLACAVPMMALAWLRYRSYLPSGDEPHYLIISQALEKYHSADVQRVYDNRDYWMFYPRWIEPHTTAGPGGARLPIHSIGAPLLWLGPFLLWGRAGAIGFMVAVSLSIIANVYWLTREIGVERGTAFGVGLAFGIGSPVLIYSSLTFVEPMGALVCVYVVRVLQRSQLRTRDLLLSSAGLGVLPWVHSRFLLFPPLFLAFLLVRLLGEPPGARRVRVLSATAPAVALLLGLVIYNLVVWGAVSLAPNQVSSGSVPFQGAPFPALAGVLFDQEAGMIPNFPIFLFVLPGVLLTLSRRYAWLHVHVLVPVLGYALLVCSFQPWYGAWSPPARFLAVVLPMLAGYVAVAVARARHVAVSAVAGGFVIYAGLLASLAVFIPDGGFSAHTGLSPTLRALGAIVGLNLNTWVPSTELGAQLPLFAAWTAGSIGFAVVVWLLGRRSRPPASPGRVQLRQATASARP